MSFKKKINVFFRQAALSLAFTAAVGSVSVAHADQTAIPQDTTNVDTFANISNAGELAQKTPQIAADFALMDKLPLTGQDLHCTLMDSSRHIISCLTSGLDSLGAVGWFARDTLRVARGSGSSVTFHECFHAGQALNGGDTSIKGLPHQDALFACFLQEATAAAYELAAEREAKNHGLLFTSPTTPPKSLPIANILAFNLAYATTWQKNTDADLTTREAKALEAGGKAVVRHLMNGRNVEWRRYYLPMEIDNVFRTVPRFNTLNVSLRDDVYTRLGAASSRINFTPEEYLGPNAGEVVHNCLENLWPTVKSSPRHTTQTP